MKKGMEFYNVIQFWENREKIIEIYNTMNTDEIETYKMYVYSIPFMDESIKDLIWETMNGWDEALFRLGKVYSKEVRKLEKRRKECESEQEVLFDVIY